MITAATISPTKRTVRSAIAGRAMASGMGAPAGISGSGAVPAAMPGPPARSSPACTATTPGIPRAPLVSIPAMRAWAEVDRTNVTHNAPSMERSSP